VRSNQEIDEFLSSLLDSRLSDIVPAATGSPWIKQDLAQSLGD